ncbi:MAG TPA: flagellar hook-associated protein FlgK [Holophaga sp.]|nr:flagellar hook-associated protein FlgK [Holophaga sp.]
MPGLTTSLNIGLSGLQAAQGALSITGHNIANVNTENYSRQRVELSANKPQTFGSMSFGSGVSVANITGLRNQYLELQIAKTTSREKGANVRYEGVEGISAVFEDDGTTGLSTLLQNYFEAFQQLAASPEDAAVRTNVVGKAQNLVDGLQSRYQMLEDQRTQADENIKNMTEEVNTLTSQIAELNHRISQEASPGADSDGRDQRQALVNQLAGLVGIQVYEDSSKCLQITLESGTAALVSGNHAYEMTATPDGTPNHFATVAVKMGSLTVDVTGQISEGSLGANLDLRDDILLGYEDQLDQLAAGIVSQTNLVHQAGYALDGTTTDVDFFQGALANGANGLPTSISAADNYHGMVKAMTLNSAIVTDHSLIAASDTTGAVGNNKNALALAKLQDKTDSVDTNGDGVGDSGPFGAMVSGLVNDIGTDIQSYKINSTSQENLLAALQTQRDRASAVDMDEEAANLITYQRGYQASAHFISVINDLTSQLLTQLGA